MVAASSDFAVKVKAMANAGTPPRKNNEEREGKIETKAYLSSAQSGVLMQALTHTIFGTAGERKIVSSLR